MQRITKVSLDEIAQKHARGEVAVPPEDAPTVDMPEGFWDSAEVRMPKTKTPVNLRVDADILDFFKQEGSGHLTRMHAVLRAYVDAKKAS